MLAVRRASTRWHEQPSTPAPSAGQNDIPKSAAGETPSNEPCLLGSHPNTASCTASSQEKDLSEMNLSNKPQLLPLLLFLVNKTLPLEVGRDGTLIVDDQGALA